MACHSCDLTALGCSGCDSHHTSSFHYGCGYGSPLLSSKTFLQEFTQHLTAGLFAEDNPSKAKIDASVAKGTLGKYGRCRLSGAVQIVGAELSQKLGLEILQKVEKVLEDDEAARKKAREQAEEEARQRAKLIAQETAKEVAKLVAEKLAPEVARKTATETATRITPDVARKAAIETALEASKKPAIDTATKIATEIANKKVQDALDSLQVSQDLQDFRKTNLIGFDNVLLEELDKGVQEASKRAPEAIQRFRISRNLLSQVPRFALYNFLVMCGTYKSL